jgi:hypothetical protein
MILEQVRKEIYAKSMKDKDFYLDGLANIEIGQAVQRREERNKLIKRQQEISQEIFENEVVIIYKQWEERKWKTLMK